MGFLHRTFRRLRYGRPVVVVSGLPRSGTSMAMRMLQAGGMEILTDGIRQPDGSNPGGYFELERVKDLDKGGETAWLRDARGKAVKIVSPLLTHLPEHANYRVIFMERDLHEVLASQNSMLVARGVPRGTPDEDAQLLRHYQSHLARVRRFLENRACFRVLPVEYHRVVDRPREAAARIDAFLGGGLDVERMAAVAQPSLYRNRRA